MVDDVAAPLIDRHARFHLGMKSVPAPCSVFRKAAPILVWSPVEWDVPGVLRTRDASFPREPNETWEASPFPVTVGSPRSFAATWVLLDDKQRSQDDAPLTIYDGIFDGGATGHATTKAEVSAHALEPGFLYAYRRCVAGCAEPLSSPLRREVVGMVGPHSVWNGASTSTDDQPSVSKAHLPFSEVSAPIAPGGSASLLVVVGGADIARFRRSNDADTEPPRDTLVHTFSLDVVWQANAEPEATYFTAVANISKRDVKPEFFDDELRCEDDSQYGNIPARLDVQAPPG